MLLKWSQENEEKEKIIAKKKSALHWKSAAYWTLHFLAANPEKETLSERFFKKQFFGKSIAGPGIGTSRIWVKNFYIGQYRENTL